MMIDSGASHIVVRNEHAHILKYIIMSETNTQPFANVRSAKMSSELSPIGRGLLQIGPFCFPAYIFRDDELQESLLGLNPLTKRGCLATFTNETFSLLHDLNKEPILHGSKTANQNSWRVAIQQYHGYHHQQFVNEIGTTLMDTLPQLQCAQKNGSHYFRIIHRHQNHSNPKLKGCPLQEIKGCSY